MQLSTPKQRPLHIGKQQMLLQQQQQQQQQQQKIEMRILAAIISVYIELLIIN